MELVDPSLPALPHHHECQGLPLHQALALVETVQASARRHAAEALDRLARSTEATIAAIALRECPVLPPTVEERIRDYRAQNRADSVMYRQALAGAAEDRGWRVHRYAPSRVLGQATKALGRPVEPLLERTRVQLGPPWRKDHGVAMAAAIAAMGC